MWNYAHAGADMIAEGDMTSLMEPPEDHLEFSHVLGPKQRQRIRLGGGTSLGFFESFAIIFCNFVFGVGHDITIFWVRSNQKYFVRVELFCFHCRIHVQIYSFEGCYHKFNKAWEKYYESDHYMALVNSKLGRSGCRQEWLSACLLQRG